MICCRWESQRQSMAECSNGSSGSRVSSSDDDDGGSGSSFAITHLRT